MDNSSISRLEHTEFAKRMEAEHDRQNHRITELEEAVKQYGALTVAVEKMAVSMEQMLNEQKVQGARLEELESRDGEKWRAITGHILTAIVGAVVCYILTHIGL